MVPAAGIGRRMGKGDPKQYREAAGAPILIHTLRTLLDSKAVEGITVAVEKDFIDRAGKLVIEYLGDRAPVSFVVGGATRQQSVYRALISLRDADVQIVVIHDAARPLVTGAIIRNAVDAARHHGAAVATIPATEASCLADDGLIAEYIDRRRHMTIQTPQAFCYDLIIKAHEQATVAGITDAVDDGILVLRVGGEVSVFAGSPQNIKVTYEGDITKLSGMATGGKQHGA